MENENPLGEKSLHISPNDPTLHEGAFLTQDPTTGAHSAKWLTKHSILLLDPQGHRNPTFLISPTLPTQGVFRENPNKSLGCERAHTG